MNKMFIKKYQDQDYYTFGYEVILDDNIEIITIPEPPELPIAEALFPAAPPPPPELGNPLPAVVPDALLIVVLL